MTFRKTGLPDADQKYWIHYDGQVSDSPRKLVIHTRQLSGSITNYGHENEMYNVGLNLKEVERL